MGMGMGLMKKGRDEITNKKLERIYTFLGEGGVLGKRGYGRYMIHIRMIMWGERGQGGGEIMINISGVAFLPIGIFYLIKKKKKKKDLRIHVHDFTFLRLPTRRKSLLAGAFQTRPDRPRTHTRRGQIGNIPWRIDRIGFVARPIG